MAGFGRIQKSRQNSAAAWRNGSTRRYRQLREAALFVFYACQLPNIRHSDTYDGSNAGTIFVHAADKKTASSGPNPHVMRSGREYNMLQNNDGQNSNHNAAADPLPATAAEKNLRPALAVARTRGQRWERYAVGVLFSVIWSSAFIAGKITVMEMGPFATLFYRFVLTVLALLPLCGKRLMGPKGRQALQAGILLGLLNNVAYLGLNFSALQRLPPSWVVIVVSCAPFMTMTMAALRGQESFDKGKLLGFAIAFTGVVIMVGITGLHAGAPLGLLMTVGATLAFSAGAVLFRGKYDDLPLLPVNFWMSVCAMLCFAPAAFVAEATPLQLTGAAQAALIWLVVVSLTGMALWLLLIRTQGPSMAASYNLLNPLSGLALSTLILGTDIGIQDVAGAAAIVAGLYVALRPRQDKKTTRQT